MGTKIESGNLPHPTNFAYRNAQPVVGSANRTPGMVFSTNRDPAQRPAVVLMTWQLASRALTEAIWSHYSENHVPFEWLDKIEDVARKLMWLSAPSVQWVSPISANVLGEFEIALAHE